MNIIIEIYDADEPSYKPVLYQMAIENNFYPHDVYANIYNFRKISPAILKMIHSMPNKQMRNSCMHKLMNDQKENEKDYIVKGYIAYDNSKNIIGFLLYNETVDNPIEIELTFLLVDRKYQKCGVGNSLLSRFLDSFLYNVKMITVKLEPNIILEKWYRKNGFISRKECEELFPSVFKFDYTANTHFIKLVYLTRDIKPVFHSLDKLFKDRKQEVKN